jgi:tripartite-type tricarboxylate transporter receptor subunit TctC
MIKAGRISVVASPRRAGAVVACVATMALLPGHRAAAADPVADFYAGKTVKILVGFGPGGGYDLYARTLARHLGRHIPGNPSILVQNMPGAGSLKVVNYLYGVAPKDGTALGTFARGIAVEPLLGHSDGIQFEAPKFNWIGSIANEVSVCAFTSASGISTWRDMQAKSYTIGSSGGGADSEVFPTVLRNMFHLPLKLVSGYQGGGADLVLAMERNEIDGRCGWSWTSLLSQNKRLYDSKRINVVVQLALAKHEDLPDVPLVMDLTEDPRQKAALKLIFSRQNIARPFAAPPGVPEERVRALRSAFDAVMRDPEFFLEAKKLDLEVRPASGADVGRLLDEIYASPPEVVQLATQVSRDARP